MEVDISNQDDDLFQGSVLVSFKNELCKKYLINRKNSNHRLFQIGLFNKN
jgi:hypothetical protein